MLATRHSGAPLVVQTEISQQINDVLLWHLMHPFMMLRSWILITLVPWVVVVAQWFHICVFSNYLKKYLMNCQEICLVILSFHYLIFSVCPKTCFMQNKWHSHRTVPELMVQIFYSCFFDTQWYLKGKLCWWLSKIIKPQLLRNWDTLKYVNKNGLKWFANLINPCFQKGLSCRQHRESD